MGLGVMGLAVSRPDPHCGAQMDETLLDLSARCQRDAQVELGVGVVGTGIDGALEMGDRLVDLAVLSENRAEAVVGLGMVRVDRQGPLVIDRRLVDSSQAF